MAEPYRFEPERVGNVDEGNNGSNNENDGAEILSNCLCHHICVHIKNKLRLFSH